MIAKFLSDAAWYFYLFWLPKYLYDARGFDIKAVATFGWIPPAAAGIGCLVGGWLSSRLLRENLPLDRARKIALGASAVLMPLILFVPSVPVAWAIVLFSIAYFGQQSWSTLVMVLPADIYPRQAVGAVAGLVGFGGAMGGVVFGQAVGYLLDHGFGYGLVFALAGSFHVLAFGVICLADPPHRADNRRAPRGSGPHGLSRTLTTGSRRDTSRSKACWKSCKAKRCVMSGGTSTRPLSMSFSASA